MSEGKRALQKDANLLTMAQNIFGDIVVNAFIGSYTYGLNNDGITKNLDSDKFEKVEVQIKCQGHSIVFEFSNGKFVEFDVSEWADISKYDMDKMECVKQ